MRNITVHNYNINANLKKEITICHISDCHLTEYDKFSTKEEIDFANQQTLHWQKMRHSFATGYKESFGGATLGSHRYRHSTRREATHYPRAIVH